MPKHRYKIIATQNIISLNVFCHKGQEQPKAWHGKCLEVSAAALPTEEQEKLIPKDYCELLTFPAYVRNIGTTLASPNLKVRR